jgi:hypothetical protein
MTEGKFSEDDKKKFIEFLNLIHKNAKFEFTQEELINYFKALSHMQQTILPKINANILEVVAVHEIEEPKKQKGKKGKK